MNARVDLRTKSISLPSIKYGRKWLKRDEFEDNHIRWRADPLLTMTKPSTKEIQLTDKKGRMCIQKKRKMYFRYMCTEGIMHAVPCTLIQNIWGLSKASMIYIRKIGNQLIILRSRIYLYTNLTELISAQPDADYCRMNGPRQYCRRDDAH